MTEHDVFDCKMCGECCTGKGGIVVSPADLTRLAGYLHLSEEDVVARYAEYSGTKLKLRNNADGACVFFLREKGCSVHLGKPAICRAWPFFRGNLVDAESYAMAREFCPGIRPNIRHEDFARVGHSYLEREQLLARDTATEANALIV